MEVDSHNISGNNFVWNGVSFNCENVQVTSLKYLPQLGCLASGYNLGVWSLISLVSLPPSYTSSIPDDPAPVAGKDVHY